MAPEKLRPYPSYGARVTEPLGNFPGHWEVRRAKVLYREVDERSQTGAEELLSVSHTTGVTPRSQKKVSMFMAESNAGHKICRPGDIVVNTMWAWMAAAGVSSATGLVSPSYAVYRTRTGVSMSDRFVDELLRTPGYRNEFLTRSTGITSSRLRLYPDEFLTIPLPIPPRLEQELIVKFVANLDRRIRQYLVAKQAQVSAVAQQRETITRRASEDPALPTVRLSAAVDRIQRPVARASGETYTPIGLYNRGRGIFHKAPTPGEYLGDSDFFWVEEGDLVLSGQFAWEGAIALASAHDDGCVASHRFYALRGRPGMAVTSYVLSYLQTPWGRMILSHHSRGAAGRNRPLNLGSLLKEKVSLPPLAVQQQVAELVELELRFRRQVTRLVELVLAYRAHVVADVVTGRVDVRDVSANLPDPKDVDLPALVNVVDQDEEIDDDDTTDSDPDLDDETTA